MLDLCLLKLAGLEPKKIHSWVIFNHMSTPQKLDILASLCSDLVHDHPRLKNYASVLSDIRAAQTARNKIVHARWYVDQGTGAVDIMHLSAPRYDQNINRAR